MTQTIHRGRRGTTALIVALVILVVGTSIWLSIDNNSGTNLLATDGKSMTRVPHLP